LKENQSVSTISIVEHEVKSEEDCEVIEEESSEVKTDINHVNEKESKEE